MPSCEVFVLIKFLFQPFLRMWMPPHYLSDPLSTVCVGVICLLPSLQITSSRRSAQVHIGRSSGLLTMVKPNVKENTAKLKPEACSALSLIWCLKSALQALQIYLDSSYVLLLCVFSDLFSPVPLSCHDLVCGFWKCERPLPKQFEAVLCANSKRCEV